MCVYETVVSEKACGICSDALQANLDDSLLPAWMPLSDYCWENVFSPSVTPSLARFQRLSRDEQLLKLVYFYYTNRPALAWDRKKPVYWPDEPMQVLQSKTFSSFLFNQGSSALVLLKTTLFFFLEILPPEVGTGPAPSQTCGNFSGAMVGCTSKLYHWGWH